jgi:hypothetical protein
MDPAPPRDDFDQSMSECHNTDVQRASLDAQLRSNLLGRLLAGARDHVRQPGDTPRQTDLRIAEAMGWLDTRHYGAPQPRPPFYDRRRDVWAYRARVARHMLASRHCSRHSWLHTQRQLAEDAAAKRIFDLYKHRFDPRLSVLQRLASLMGIRLNVQTVESDAVDVRRRYEKAIQR